MYQTFFIIFTPITICVIMQDIVNGRCGWCGTDELYVKYHDQEWGKLVTNDKMLFEFLVLESAQAGLSWITILKNIAKPFAISTLNGWHK